MMPLAAGAAALVLAGCSAWSPERALSQTVTTEGDLAAGDVQDARACGGITNAQVPA